VAAVVLLGLFVPTPIRDRVLTEHQQNPVSYARWQMWQGAVAQMVDHPFGIGLGLYQYTYPLYAFPIDGEISRFGKVAQTPHNDYLQMGVEMGPGAILVFGIGVVLLIRELRQVLQSRLRRWQRSLIVGIGGGVMALLTHAALDSSLRESALAIMLALCSAMIVSAARLTRRGADAVYVIPIHSRWTWGIGVACLVLVVGVEVTRLGVAWMKFDAASRRGHSWRHRCGHRRIERRQSHWIQARRCTITAWDQSMRGPSKRPATSRRSNWPMRSLSRRLN
jgi:hypothetical protein